MKEFLKTFKKGENLSFERYKKYNLDNGNKYFYLGEGEEHYQLLAKISREFSGKMFFDIGTYRGCSALALGFNKENKVISYDVLSCLCDDINESNIEFNIGDAIQDNRLLESDLIMLDTAHDGVFEQKILDFLTKEKYKGIVIMDDVNLYPSLRIIAEKTHLEILDLTPIGHYTGTLAIFFS